MRALVSVVLVCSIVALLLTAGCTFNLKNADGSLNKSFSTNKGSGTPGGGTPGSTPEGGTTRGETTSDGTNVGDTDRGTSGGKSGGIGSGSVGYPDNTYFSINCKGEWKLKTIQGDPPWNHHGTFAVIGYVPFPITYDYRITGFGSYTATDISGSGQSSPLHLTGESSWCEGPADDCKPCHLIFDGEIYAGGHMNLKKGTGGMWNVSFNPAPSSKGEPWHINSIQQTEGGCPIPSPEALGPMDFIGPAEACFSADRGTVSGNFFMFSDGSGITVSPHVDTGDYVFTSLDPRAVFHIGRAPS